MPDTDLPNSRDCSKLVEFSRKLSVVYKKNVSDLRESPALGIIQLLQEKGAVVEYDAPFVTALSYDGIHSISITKFA